MQLQITTPGSGATLTSCPISPVSRRQLGSCRARLRSHWRCSAQAGTWSQCSNSPAAGPLVQSFCQPSRRPDCSERCQPLRATSSSHQNQSSSSRSSKLAAFGRLFRSRYDADIFRLAIPALMSILLDPVMSLVDTALVGRLGAAELGAVGLSSLIFNLSNFLFNFLLIVTTPKIAAAVARSDTEAASQTTAQGLWIGAGIGILMGTAIWFLGPPAMQALQAEPAVAHHAVTYLRCRAVASPAVLSLYVVIGSFRGWADTRTPLVASIFANVANLVGDCVLMFGFGWGVAGAALATSFSQYCSLGILLAMGIRKGMLKFSDLRYPPDPRDIGALLRSGLALSLRNTANLAVIMSVTGLVTKLGSIHLAAHEIIRQVYIFSLQSFSSFDIAAQTLIASYLGRGNRAVARDVLLRVVQIGTAIGLGMMLLIFNFRSSIPRIFSQDPAVVKLAADTLIVIALYLPLDAIAQILEGGLLGASDTGYIGKAAIVTAGLAFIAVILTFRSYPTLPGLWFGLKTLTLGRLATGSYRYMSKNAPLGQFDMQRKWTPRPASRASVSMDETSGPAAAAA